MKRGPIPLLRWAQNTFNPKSPVILLEKYAEVRIIRCKITTTHRNFHKASRYLLDEPVVIYNTSF
jgi:hypothetical protein